MNVYDLEKVRVMDKLINAKIAERQRLYEIATGVSSKPFDGMPHSSSGIVSSTVEKSVVKLITLAEELDRLIDDYIDYKQSVVNALEKLPEKEYTVLHKYYIQYKSWDEIADEMNYSRVSVWRFWKKGLNILKDETKCN
jgi:DNA-directed RNA polymerase specialized sigma subunit